MPRNDSRNGEEDHQQEASTWSASLDSHCIVHSDMARTHCRSRMAQRPHDRQLCESSQMDGQQWLLRLIRGLECDRARPPWDQCGHDARSGCLSYGLFSPIFGAQATFPASYRLRLSCTSERIYTPTNPGTLYGDGDFAFLQRLPTLHLFDTRPTLFYPQLVLWVAVYPDVWLGSRWHSRGSG